LHEITRIAAPLRTGPADAAAARAARGLVHFLARQQRRDLVRTQLAPAADLQPALP